MKSFDNKVAAVTGAGSGIGRALAVALAEAGCALALSDVDEPGLAGTVELVKGARVTHQRVDVADRAAVIAWADAVVRDHGRCNLVFNNAGIAYAATVEHGEYEQLHKLMNINFWGVVHGTQAFLPHLRASGDGHVVNTSSIFGIVAFPGNSIYNASKFAVRGYTECLQEELAVMKAPVLATSVHPGGIKTNIVRGSRVHESMRDLGIDPDRGGQQFEKLFKTTPEEAARVILRGVKRGSKRVLIGNDAHLLDAMQRTLPGSYQNLVVDTFVRRRKVRS